MLKKTTALFLIFLLCAGILSGCSDDISSNSGKLKIVCTIFPQYDWAREILGEKLEDTELTLLLDSGTDLHSYQPTAADIIKITSCDIFIYTGGESDKWVKDVANSTDCRAKTLNLMEILGDSAYEEETVEGMEAESGEEEADGDEDPEYDEHIWLSIKNADKLCVAVKDAIASADPSNASVYDANCTKYRQDLAVLESEYAQTVNSAARKTVLFADRFPFRYLTEDYGLEYFAAFSGCSAESEASFETLSFLAKKTDEYALPVILVTETSDQSVAKTVRDNTTSKDQQILVMNAMQSVTADKLATGITYIDTMKSNLEILKTALN